MNRELENAINLIKKAEMILSSYEDEELQQISKDLSESREILIKNGLLIIQRAIETENQQKKWLLCINQVLDELKRGDVHMCDQLIDKIENCFKDY